MRTVRLSSGMIVARVELVDVVPIAAIEDEDLPPCVAVGPTDLTLWEVPDYWHNESDEVDVSDQLPYGDFTPGRYAWMLEGVTSQAVPFRGGQGLTRRYEGIPVLTLWEPWATLVREGIKSLETRSWSTAYRGPIYIHAAARRPGDGLVVGDWTVRHVYHGGSYSHSVMEAA